MSDAKQKAKDSTETLIESLHASRKKRTLLINPDYLDDEKLPEDERSAVLKEIFNKNIRGKQLSRIISHLTDRHHFEPYDALDLLEILKLRSEKALLKDKVDEAALRKIAAYASRETGDARKAVELLAKCVFRRIPDTHSDSFRTVIPIHFGHPFRFISDTHSNPIRTVLFACLDYQI